MATLDCPGITELQAGGVIFMDLFYRERCHVAEFDFALTILATVVSRPAPDRAIIDAGRKTMNMELLLPRVMGRDDITVFKNNGGSGLQFAAVAPVVYERARAAGIGRKLPAAWFLENMKS